MSTKPLTEKQLDVLSAANIRRNGSHKFESVQQIQQTLEGNGIFRSQRSVRGTCRSLSVRGLLRERLWIGKNSYGESVFYGISTRGKSALHEAGRIRKPAMNGPVTLAGPRA